MKYLKRLIAPLLFLGLMSPVVPAEQQEVNELVSESLEHLQQEDYDAALKCLEKALLIKDSDPALYRLQGQILEILEQPEAAIVAWQKCLELANDQELGAEAKHHIENLSQ